MDTRQANSPEEVIRDHVVELLTATIVCHHESPEDPPTRETNNLAILQSLSTHLKPHIIHFITDSTSNKRFFRLTQSTPHNLPTVLEFIMTAASEIIPQFFLNCNINPTNTSLQNKIEINDIITASHNAHIQHIYGINVIRMC